MKARILIAVVVSAATLLSFSLVKISPAKANQQKVASSTTLEPAGGLVVEEMHR